MSLALKSKPLTKRQLTNIILDYEERFEAITDSLDNLQINQPDYAGSLTLNVFDVNENLTNYYMVTKFCIQDPYITFYHLIPPETDGSFTINSFPDKPKNQSTRKFIRGLEKTGRWNKVYEQLFIPSVERTQFIGRFTYTKMMELEDNRAKFIKPDSSILQFKATDNSGG